MKHGKETNQITELYFACNWPVSLFLGRRSSLSKQKLKQKQANWGSLFCALLRTSSSTSRNCAACARTKTPGQSEEPCPRTPRFTQSFCAHPPWCTAPQNVSFANCSPDYSARKKHQQQYRCAQFASTKLSKSNAACVVRSRNANVKAPAGRYNPTWRARSLFPGLCFDFVKLQTRIWLSWAQKPHWFGKIVHVIVNWYFHIETATWNWRSDLTDFIFYNRLWHSNLQFKWTAWQARGLQQNNLYTLCCP